MPAKTKTESDGFSAEERAAMKQRAAELRAEGKGGAKKADALQAALDSIAAMAPHDRALAERVHVTVTETAPDLSPKTWYGMPAYANADGKVVLSFKNAGKWPIPAREPPSASPGGATTGPACRDRPLSDQPGGHNRSSRVARNREAPGRWAS